MQDSEAVAFLGAVFGALPPCERLFDCFPAAFRRRWDSILRSLKIPKDAGLTPGGVKGGGCVYAFQNGMKSSHAAVAKEYQTPANARVLLAVLPRQW